MVRALATLFLTLLPLLTAEADPIRRIEDAEVTVLAQPAFDRRAAKAVPSAGLLALVSSKPNQITDEAAWFERNALELARFDPGNLPAGIPPTFRGAPLVQALYGPVGTILLYGRDYAARYLVGVDAGMSTVRYAFDFSSFLAAPGQPEDSLTEQSVTWAVEEGGVLYVANGHRTYAASSGGRNAYLTAIDVKAGRILWRSQPLVANANTFEVLREGIVTGYGFTREPDYLYLLDRKTGAVTARTKVKSGPEYILAREGKLYVRCYDTDYVFEIRKGGRP